MAVCFQQEYSPDGALNKLKIMVNRRERRDEDIGHSLETRVSAPGDGRPAEEERISEIYELTDIGQLTETDAKKVLEGVDILNTPLTDLIIAVQKKVEAILQKTK